MSLLFVNTSDVEQRGLQLSLESIQRHLQLCAYYNYCYYCLQQVPEHGREPIWLDLHLQVWFPPSGIPGWQISDIPG